MAKKRQKKGTGSVITVRKLSGRGIGSLNNPSSGVGAVLPPLVGGGLAGASTVLIEHLATPTGGEAPSDFVMKMGDYAPYIGAGVGALGSIALFAMVGQPQGYAAMAGAIGTAGSLIMSKALRKSKASQGVNVDETVAAQNGNGTQGRYRTGAVVPQLQPYGMSGRRNPNTGAIVMEPVATHGLGRGRSQGTGDPRGETVTLGNVNPSAFGTPGFQV